MNKDRRKWLAASAATLATGALIWSEGHRKSNDGDVDTKDFSQDAAGRLAAARMEGYFPNVLLTTHENQSVRFYDDLLRDKAVIIGFMYTSCDGLCPRTMANLIGLRKALRESGRQDLHFYGMSIDPANDTPKALAAYAKDLNTGGDFTFLTGQPADMTLVRRKLGVFHPDPVIDADRTQHSGLIVVGNEPAGRWARVPGLMPPKRIMRTIARVAPRGKLGTGDLG